MTTAIVTYNNVAKQYEAHVHGELTFKGTTKRYVMDQAGGRARKAIKLGITSVVDHTGEANSVGHQDVSKHVFETDAARANPVFTPDQRYQFLADFSDLVITGDVPSLLVLGRGGLGKTFTIVSRLKAAGKQEVREVTVEKPADEPPTVEEELGLVEVEDNEPDTCLVGDYTIIKGYTTARALYETLYRNNDKIILLDDCDKALKNEDAIGILKAALDTCEERIVAWNSANAFSDLPRKFVFTGKIIFISNLTSSDIDTALKTRTLRVDLSMTNEELVERMGTIVKGGEFMPEIDAEVVNEAYEFIKENAGVAKNLSMRSLIMTVWLRKGNTANWKTMALYNLVAS